MRTGYTDRSRIETFQRCPRSRFLQYHLGGLGIESASKPLPLAVGGAVHVGLEHLLLGDGEDVAVEHAVADLAQYRTALALDTTELASQQPLDSTVALHDMALQLGMSVDDPALGQLGVVDIYTGAGARAFDNFLWQEQSGLVEGLVRAYARRRLAPLLEEYEVLEVEREGQWQLHVNYLKGLDLWFCSRPDALLRERSTGHLYIQSFKTTGAWDVRKERDAQHDMQGLSEGVEVEKRLAGWWQEIQTYGPDEKAWAEASGSTVVMAKYLAGLPEPPRIMGIRYEYILKGERWKDEELSQRVGFQARSQRSHLIRAYTNLGMTPDDTQRCWSYDYLKEDGQASKLYYKNWRSKPVWESGLSIKAWIDLLDDSHLTTVADEQMGGGRELGYSSAAQAQGYTRQHPLDAVFIPPVVVYRQDDDLRDWIEQVEAQEVRVAQAVAQVEAAGDGAERRSLLNEHFPQTRRACEYPTTCQFVKVCYGSADMREDPKGSGLYVDRVPNHPQERSNRATG